MKQTNAFFVKALSKDLKEVKRSGGDVVEFVFSSSNEVKEAKKNELKVL